MTRISAPAWPAAALAFAMMSGCSDTTGSTGTFYDITIRINGSGTGTVSITPPLSGYPAGSTVSAQAYANNGSVFTGWGGDQYSCTQPTNPCTLLVDTTKIVVAKFAASTGAPQYDGLYTGSVGGSNVINLTLTNGVVQGKTASAITGSATTFSGTVSATGAVTARATTAGTNGCNVTLNGQITTQYSGFITKAALAGTYTPDQSCVGVAGAWTATRDLVTTAKLP